MRKSFDGLCALVQSVLKQDPFSGHLFTFVNRRRDKVKILYWDRSGFFLLYKRLEEGTFWMPESEEIGARELMMVLEGLEASEVRQRRRYQRVT
jgi:transposase